MTRVLRAVSHDKRTRFALAGGLAALSILLFLLVPGGESLPDFRAYEAGPERKDAFFSYLTPIVEEANKDILKTRQRLLSLDPAVLSFWESRWLSQIADDYAVDLDDKSNAESISALLTRVDTVPESLALAQAAKESGWGTSRFAREGNNLFGEWCFEEGCGVVPGKRSPGKTHEVERFDSPRESIDSYLSNLNTHRAYREVRQIRSQLRADGKHVSGQALAGGLSKYSERGQVYVAEVRSLIRGNNLE